MRDRGIYIGRAGTKSILWKFPGEQNKNFADSICRLCDSIGHIACDCPIWLPNIEMITLNSISTGKYYNTQHGGKWYKHHPELIIEDHEVNILCDFINLTERHIKAILMFGLLRPNILIKDF